MEEPKEEVKEDDLGQEHSFRAARGTKRVQNSGGGRRLVFEMRLEPAALVQECKEEVKEEVKEELKEEAPSRKKPKQTLSVLP